MEQISTPKRSGAGIWLTPFKAYGKLSIATRCFPQDSEIGTARYSTGKSHWHNLPIVPVPPFLIYWQCTVVKILGINLKHRCKSEWFIPDMVPIDLSVCYLFRILLVKVRQVTTTRKFSISWLNFLEKCLGWFFCTNYGRFIVLIWYTGKCVTNTKALYTNFIPVTKSGRSASKFRKSQICKFADLIFFLELRIFHKCANLRFADHIFLAICGPNYFLRT